MNWHRAIEVTLVLALLAVLVMLPSPVRASPDIVTLRPDGAGDEATLTLFGDTANYLCVDEITSDNDTTYVEGGGASYLTDLYSTENTTLAGKGTINSVTVYVNCRGAEKAGTSAHTRIQTNSVAYDGAEISLTTSYAAYSTAYTTNPQTGSAWTWEEVNNLQAGVGLKKPTGGATARCTQVWVEVDYTPVTNWSSYDDALHTPPECDLFENSTNHVYMKGENFASGTLKVGYYDASDNWAMSESFIGFAGGNLTGECDLNQAWGDPLPAGDGTWHAVVIYTSDNLSLTTYAEAIAHTDYVIDDDFYVANSAIPEFPTIIAAIIVAGLCFGIYYWMRKRRLAYVSA